MRSFHGAFLPITPKSPRRQAFPLPAHQSTPAKRPNSTVPVGTLTGGAPSIIGERPAAIDPPRNEFQAPVGLQHVTLLDPLAEFIAELVVDGTADR